MVVPDTQYHSWPAIQFYCHIPLVITKIIGGYKAKVCTPLAVMQQEFSTLLPQQLSGRLIVYSDGPVIRDGSVAAACVMSSVGEVLKCRLLSLAFPWCAATIICDSWVTLATILREQDASLFAQKITQKLPAMQPSGCDLSLHWVPSHIGTPSNGEADHAAKDAHDPGTGVTNFVCSADAGRLLPARYVRERHPNLRLASKPQ
ncbi:hypothetical protein MRX96_056947 [Rhipicephalus microplus]